MCSTVDHCICMEFRQCLARSSVVLTYLTGRSQQVSVNREFPESFEVNWGVPQGSCLGPLLFTTNSSKFISSPHMSACFPFFSHPQQRVVPTFPVFIPHQLPFHYACPCNYSSLIPQFTITTFTTQYSPLCFPSLLLAYLEVLCCNAGLVYWAMNNQNTHLE